MYEVKEETLKNAYKPYDVVSDNSGNVGIITEVNVNDSQSAPEHQISYSIEWIVGSGGYSAWWSHEDLNYHTNIFLEISKASCHPMGNNSGKVENLFNNFNL